MKQLEVPVLFIIGKEDKAIAAEKTLQLTSLPERSVICLLEKQVIWACLKLHKNAGQRLWNGYQLLPGDLVFAALIFTSNSFVPVGSQSVGAHAAIAFNA